MSETVEDYLQAIYLLSGPERQPVAGIRIAERMKVAHATVVGTVRRLVRDGLVVTDARKKILLTDRGRQMAEDVVRRHCLAERFCTDILGMEWYRAHEEAHHIEHALSPEVRMRLAEVLGHPERCPHGNPIPGSGYVAPEGLQPLTEAAPGPGWVVDSIAEEMEDEPRLLAYLDQHQVVPGRPLEVLENEPLLGTVTVRAGDAVATISRDIAAQVRVAPRTSGTPG